MAAHRQLEVLEPAVGSRRAGRGHPVLRPAPLQIEGRLEVCRAQEDRAVAGIVEVVGHGRDVSGQWHSVCVHAVGAGVLARQHAGPCWHAHDVLVHGALVVDPCGGQMVSCRQRCDLAPLHPSKSQHGWSVVTERIVRPISAPFVGPRCDALPVLVVEACLDETHELHQSAEGPRSCPWARDLAYQSADIIAFSVDDRSHVAPPRSRSGSRRGPSTIVPDRGGTVAREAPEDSSVAMEREDHGMQAGWWCRCSGALLLLIAVALGALAAPALPAAGASVQRAGVPPIAWTACAKETGYRCGTLRVPLDYRHPARGTIGLAVIEHPVPHSAGVVVFNPGGPGESGVLILPILAALVPPTVRDDYTLVSFDERGTGSSDPLLCGPTPAAASAAVPTIVSGVRTFATVEPSCRSRYPALFPTVDTTTSARDMNRLRQALGVSRIDYYGLSYGTALGSVYAHLFPDHYQAMVLDGAVDANLSLASEAREEAPALEAALVHALDGCASAPGCPLGSDPVAAYRRLEQRLSRSPLALSGGEPAVTVGDLFTASLLYLSAPKFTSGYFAALASAEAGNGGPLRTFGVELEEDLNGSSLVGPLWTITCNDASTHPGVTSTVALARALGTRYPLIGAEAVSNNLIGCPGWSEAGGSIAHLDPTTGPVPLVIGNTGDPNTPYVEAGQLARTIGGRLVTYVGYGHTWLLNGSSNACMQAVVSAYLTAGRLPARGTRCDA